MGPTRTKESTNMWKIFVILMSFFIEEPIFADFEESASPVEIFNQEEYFIECPCCGVRRRWPSKDYFEWHCTRFTPNQLQEFALEVRNYVGDVVRNRYCRFCGHVTPRDI